MYIEKNIKNNTGFTLIELLVSIALFSIALIISLGAVLNIIDLNRKTQAMASVTNNVNFAVESLTRIVKSAESITGSTASGVSCDPGSDTQIKLEYIDTYGIFAVGGEGLKDVYYRHNCAEGTLERQVTLPGNGTSGSWSIITSEEDLEVVRIVFDVINDDQQKLELLIEGLATIGGETSSFIIQTTASRRGY